MSENKIGILTFYYTNTNYGGQCQAYALQKALNKLEFNAEQICYKTTSPEVKYKNVSLREKIIKIFKNPGEIFVNKIVNPSIKKKMNTRLENFNKFKKDIPHSEMVYTDDTIKEANRIYDIFVCGSDQIWKDWGTNSDTEKRNYILGFSEPSKITLSYAVSLGVTELSDDYKMLLMEEMRKFKALSVREKSAIELLTPLTKKNVIEVVDPVLLLSKDEWSECAISPKERDYIFCYFLSDNKKMRAFAKRISKQLGCKIVTIPYAAHHNFNIADCNFGDIKAMSAGPREFIGYIKDAKLVLTDSFHAMVFSSIFNKNFYVFKRGHSMNGRISDFLEAYGLENRLIDEDEKVCFENIEYTKYNEIIQEKKKSSLKYLTDNLTVKLV